VFTVFHSSHAARVDADRVKKPLNSEE